MTLEECVNRVDGTWAVEAEGVTEFHDVVVSDLMSDVLVVEEEDFLLVTSLTSEQVLRTADIVDARAILITNGKQPQQKMQSLAEKHGIPVIVTRLSTFNACRAIADCRE